MSQKVEISKELFHESLVGVLENAKVPMQQHLGALKVIEMNLAKSKKDRDTHQQFMLSHAKHMAAHSSQLKAYDQKINDLTTQIDHLKSLVKGEPGDAGYTPVKGKDYFDGKTPSVPSIAEIVEAIKPHIPEPLKGDKGDNATFDKDTLVREIISYIKTQKPLDLSHIKGAQEFVMQTGQKNIKVKFEELMHGGGSGGGNTGTAVYNEVVSGSGTSWALTNTPTTGTLRLYANGQRLIPGAGNDYTLSGGNITTALSWSAGTLLADYSHS